MFACEALLYLPVVIYLALLCVDQQYLSRLQTSLLRYLRRFEVHYAHLARHDHGVALCYCVARGAQTVAVEQSSGKAPVAEEQCRRTVPRFHKYGVILVKSLQVFRNGVLVVEALGHHYGHGVGQ